MYLLTRYASVRISLGSILFFQNIIGLLTLLPWLIHYGTSLLRTDNFGLILFRSIVSLSSILLSFIAVQKISLVDTMLFNNSSPLWLPFIFLLWRKIPINHRLWPGIIAGFLGILFILQPGKEALHVGSVFALASGILASINMVSLRLLSHTERNHTVMFYYFVICSILCLPVSVLTWRQPGFVEWVQILGAGILFALGQWAFVRAFHYAKATLLGPFSYAAVVYAMLLDWWIYNQTPNYLAWIGIPLICLGGIWAIRFSESKVSPS
jgi:drug/metabolite transporter (DMT)-like permease